jgi:hypothetical protein
MISASNVCTSVHDNKVLLSTVNHAVLLCLPFPAMWVLGNEMFFFSAKRRTTVRIGSSPGGITDLDRSSLFAEEELASLGPVNPVYRFSARH